MALMLKVCDMRERNPGGDRRYRYIAGRIDEQTRIVLMPSREAGADDGDWVLYIAPDAKPPADGSAEEAPSD
jgi:hypothetical protein